MSDDYGAAEFTTRRFQIAQLAEWAVGAVPSSPTQEVNGCFQVTVGEELLQLAAADVKQAVFAETGAVLVKKAGTVYLPARKLRAILAEAGEGDVTVTARGNQARVTAGSASWQLRLPAPGGYAGLPDLDGAEFRATDREILLGALSTVRHAVGKDGGRPAFTQVRIGPEDDGVFACATDSGQFSRAPVPGFPGEVLVPGVVLGDLVKLLDKVPVKDVEVAVTGPYSVFRAGAVTLAARGLAKDFPAVADLFLRPTAGNDMALGVDKAELAAALKRVQINANPMTSAVALIADRHQGAGRLTVTGRDDKDNSAEQVIPASWGGEQHVMVVNGTFLAAMVAAHPSAVCEFRLGKDRGQSRAPLVLEDPAAKVTGICRQLSARMGY